MALRRGLLALVLFCSSIIFYLYWNQTYTIPQMFRSEDNVYIEQQQLRNVDNIPNQHVIVKTGGLERKVKPNGLNSKWTWECVNQRCEKVLRTEKPPTSLTTCNMLCGSTQLWPQPTGPVSLGSRAVTFYLQQLHFQTTVSEPAKTFLKHLYSVFLDNISKLVQKSNVLTENSDIKNFFINVTVTDVNQTRLKLNTDESYHLTVRPIESALIATIEAKTVFGARHGLETLSQLIWWDEYASDGMLKVVKGATVQDAPVFAYRGLMVDTSRNFMPIDGLKRALIGMAASKLNVFHWHITDSQSFPFLSSRVPQLAKYGAYQDDMVYTAKDIKEFVEFARFMGIRVVIEIDTPAHAGNGWTWGPEHGLGNLAVCVNEQPWSMYCGEPPCGQLNPQNPNTYDILEKLYKDILELSEEDEIFHIGGDEVNLECWSQHLYKDSTTRYSDLHDLWGEFTVNAVQRLKAANGGKNVPNVIVWSSNLSKRPYSTKYLDKNVTIVQTWGPSEWTETTDLLRDGYKIIVSHVDAWYLDCGFGRWREIGGAACDPYRTWHAMYNHRPWHTQHLDRRLIVGGEACLWSEQLDSSALDSRIWPRAAAMAERVWSDPQDGTGSSQIHEDVYTRLATHRDRLISRGLKPEAMWPRWCTQNPGMCL